MKKYFLFCSILVALFGCSNPVKTSSSIKDDSLSMIKEIQEEAKPVFIKTYKIVHEIMDDVDLAKQGLLPKSAVIQKYNEVLGPEMGRLKTLTQIKARLDTAGEGYIKYKFIKAQAEIAREKAAEKKHTAIKNSIH